MPGTKQTLSSAMAGEDHDKTKVDPKNIINAEYDDLPEDKLQALEAYIKQYEADCKRRMASCFGKTQHGLVEKEKFIMPTLPPKVQNNVSTNAIPEHSNIESVIKNIFDARVESLVDLRMQSNMNFDRDEFELQNKIPKNPSASNTKVDSGKGISGEREDEGRTDSANNINTMPISTSIGTR
jgi:hypothetical protein